MNSSESLAPRPSTSIVPPGTLPTAAALRDEAGLSPALLALAVRKNWVLVVVALVLCLAGTSLYTARQTRIFEAAATIQMDPQPLMPLGNQHGKEGPESFWSNQEYFATQHQI